MSILNYSHIILVLFIIWVPVSFFTTYAITVAGNHSLPLFAYISDTGTNAPESCIFGQLLDIMAFLFIFLACVRYFHVKYASQQNEYQHIQKSIHRTNMAALIVAFISAFGVTMVGNFQETVLFEVHVIGAFPAFFALLIYAWINSILSHKLSLVLYSNKIVFAIRLIMCTVATICILIMIPFQFIASSKFDGADFFFWSPNDNGFAEHATSVSAEWAMSMITGLVLLSFYPDYKNIKFHEIETYDARVTPRVETIEINEKYKH